jgi:hypothetical protein
MAKRGGKEQRMQKTAPGKEMAVCARAQTAIIALS